MTQRVKADSSERNESLRRALNSFDLEYTKLKTGYFEVAWENSKLVVDGQPLDM